MVFSDQEGEVEFFGVVAFVSVNLNIYLNKGSFAAFTVVDTSSVQEHIIKTGV